MVEKSALVFIGCYLKKLLAFKARSFFIGVFRRGNKPSVLPRDRKTSGATIERASLMRAERLKNKKNLVYNSSGLATAY